MEHFIVKASKIIDQLYIHLMKNILLNKEY